MRKELPTSRPGSQALFGLPYEVLKWEVLKTALELNLFDRLSEPATADRIAESEALHPTNTEYLLDALVALGCLHKANGHYRNTALAASFLASDKETSLGPSLLFMESWTTSLLNGGLADRVKNGPPPPLDMSDDSLWEKGARASLNHSRCGRAQRVAEEVADLPEFSSFVRTLDLGAGSGIIGIAVTAAHPSMHCVLFEQSAVAVVAREVVAEYGMEDRVTVMQGSYMEDDIGSGYDLVMAHFTLNFYRDRLDELMRKVRDALNPGGVFLVTSDGLNRDKTAPMATVISWLPTKLLGMDMSFQSGQIARAMHTAGFVSTERQTLTDMDLEAHGPVEMTVGRKRIGQ
jgi:SAM-dependent methyltransferase